MKLLSIGNSFSQDAQEWLHRIAVANGVELETTNLMIGGCSLETHWNHITDGIADYYLEQNGQDCQRMITLPDALEMDEWDVITVQQVSGLSGIYDSHYPYLTTVLEYIRTLCPTAKIVWNQTWAYATYSTHGDFPRYDRDQDRMLAMIEETSRRVAEENALERIEVGRVIQALRRQLPPDGTELCRDGFHLSFDYGRYAAAYAWAKFFRLPVNDYLPDGANAERIAQIVNICDALLG